MIKGLLCTVAAVIMAVVLYTTNILGFMGHKAVLYGAFAVVVGLLVAARIILGSPLGEDDKDDEGDN